MTRRTGRGRRFGCLLFLFLLMGAAWLGRGAIGDWLGRLDLVEVRPSERLARSASQKLERLNVEGVRSATRFSEAELQSLLTYGATEPLPPGIEDPRVDVQDTLVVLSARVRAEELGGFEGSELLETVLADTARVLIGLTPHVGRPGELMLRVRSLQIGEIVIPPMFLPAVVAGLTGSGFVTRDGSIVAAVDPSVGAVRLEGDDVVLEPARGSVAPDPGG